MSNENNNGGALTLEAPPTKQEKYLHFGVEVRLGSRKITIKQVPKFSLLPKTPEAASIRNEQIRKIGSQWKKGTRDLIKGLTSKEELVYLPSIIGISPSSPNWNNAVRDFWADFSIPVPVDGVEIEAGFKLDEDDKVVPINLEGYMRYNFCLQNSDVASTEEGLDNPIMFVFYMIDKLQEQITEEQQFLLRTEVNKAYAKFLALSETNSQYKYMIDWIIELYGGDLGKGMNTMGLTPTKKLMELEKVKERDLANFRKILNDSDLEMKAFIRKSVELGSLAQEGNSYMFQDKVIGSSLKEAVAYFKNEANQKDKLIVQERNKGIVS